MAGDIKLKQGNAGSLVNLQASGTSAALANGAVVAAATAILDNTSYLCPRASFRLTPAGFTSSTGVVGTTVDLYLLTALDGATYEDIDTTTPVVPAGAYVGSFVIIDTTSTTPLDIKGIPLDPWKYKAYIQNKTGQQMTLGWKLDAVVSEEQYT